MKEPRPDPVPPAMEWQTRNPSSDSEPEAGTAEAVPQARGMHPPPPPSGPQEGRVGGERGSGCGCGAPPREAMAGATRERKMEVYSRIGSVPRSPQPQTRNLLPYTQERKPRPRIGTRGRCLHPKGAITGAACARVPRTRKGCAVRLRECPRSRTVRLAVDHLQDLLLDRAANRVACSLK